MKKNEQIEKKYIKNYFINKYNLNTDNLVKIELLGEGFVAKAYKVSLTINNKTAEFVVRRLLGKGMSRDYISDQVENFLLQHNIANSLPHTVKSRDVFIVRNKVELSISDPSYVYQVMDFAKGIEYTEYFSLLNEQQFLNESHKQIIKSITDVLTEIHSIKPDAFSHEDKKSLYFRHSQDFIGSQVFMDVIDCFPDFDFFNKEKKSEMMKLLFCLREKNKHNFSRLSKIHADLHPGNLRISKRNKITLIDGARTLWGEPADDIASMAANYLKKHFESKSTNKSASMEALELFINSYIDQTKDTQVFSLWQMFLAVRLTILANPLFFKDIDISLSKNLIDIAFKILKASRVDLKFLKKL